MKRLGDLAKDNVTGFVGIIVGVSRHLHGCSHVYLQPRGLKDNGLPHNPLAFDDQRTEVIEEQVIKGFNMPDPLFKPGNVVRDVVSGFEGVVLTVSVWAGEKTLYCVQPSTLFEGVPVDNTYFQEGSLELVCASKPVVAPSSTATTGGPPHMYPAPPRV